MWQYGYNENELHVSLRTDVVGLPQYFRLDKKLTYQPY